MTSRIAIQNSGSAFEREPLRRPFGFKGRYLTELWQVVARLTSDAGISGVGLGTQSVLYGDASLFSTRTEAEGNALMYELTAHALDAASTKSFSTPLDLMQQLIPEVLEKGKRLAGKKDLNPNFVYNALVSVDHAAWVLYREQCGFAGFDDMIPDAFRTALSHRHDRIALMYQVSYDAPLEELSAAADAGYFVFKIKTGHPGSQREMLEKDLETLSAIHRILGKKRTPHTPGQKLYYTLDANGRYQSKELLLRYLDHARRIGAFDHILLYEEPVSEGNEEDLSDTGVRIAGDESIHDVKSAERKIAQGYQVIVLKGIAKTLSLSLEIAKVAYERNVACFCADLTVNPILADWHKNLAGRLAPFPGIGMGLMESNGAVNYQHWDKMLAYNPAGAASWSQPVNGMFALNEAFFSEDGGIWKASPHYSRMVT